MAAVYVPELIYITTRKVCLTIKINITWVESRLRSYIFVKNEQTSVWNTDRNWRRYFRTMRSEIVSVLDEQTPTHLHHHTPVCQQAGWLSHLPHRTPVCQQAGWLSHRRTPVCQPNCHWLPDIICISSRELAAKEDVKNIKGSEWSDREEEGKWKEERGQAWQFYSLLSCL